MFVYRDVPYRGSFRCSDTRLNAIYDTAAYTCHLCLQNRLWDGIKRDRLVWIGDTHPEMLAIRTLFGREPLLEQSLDTACGEAALPGWMNGMPAYSMWWLLILRDWYQYTGDKAFPAKHREYIRALTAQILRQVEPDGRLALDDYFLDWSTHGMPEARAGVQALHEYHIAHDREELRRGALYFGVILFFALGAVAGNLAVGRLGLSAIRWDCLLLVLPLLMMLSKPDESKEENK